LTDKEGVAIIMCESELKQKYEALSHGRTLLESSLHLNLSEHINSEIGLGTICNIPSAKQWLTSSFLYQRIQQNPKHYGIGRNENQTWQARVGEMVTDSIEKLKENHLVSIADDGSDAVKSTEYGDIMSKVSILLA
jgi:ATP-dependent DNA helicase HFM1/MER3